MGAHPGSGRSCSSTVPKGSATWMVAEDLEAKGQSGGEGSPEPCGLQAGRDGCDPALLADVRDDGNGGNRRLDGHRSIGSDGQGFWRGQNPRPAPWSQYGCSNLCAFCRPPGERAMSSVL